MDEQALRKKKRRKRRRRMRRLKNIALVVLIAGLLLVIAYLLLDGRDAQHADSADLPTVEATQEPDAPLSTDALSISKLQIDPNAGDLVTPTPAASEPGVAIPGWGKMSIPAGETQVSTSMQNPEANSGWYYLTFELRLKDTDEVLFTTGLIPPGQYCNQVTLNRPLEAGEYAAVIHVQPYRISDQSPTNSADMETVLIVE